MPCPEHHRVFLKIQENRAGDARPWCNLFLWWGIEKEWTTWKAPYVISCTQEVVHNSVCVTLQKQGVHGWCHQMMYTSNDNITLPWLMVIWYLMFKFCAPVEVQAHVYTYAKFQGSVGSIVDHGRACAYQFIWYNTSKSNWVFHCYHYLSILFGHWYKQPTYRQLIKLPL